MQRLVDSCLGQEPPEIVGFDSSVGFNLTYCEKHPKQKICVLFQKDLCENHPEQKICADRKP